MIVFIILAFTLIICIGTYIHGYEQGYIDGKLDEKWRVRDERKVKNITRNSTNS